MQPIRVTHILEATLGGTARHLADIGCGLADAGFLVEALVSLERAEGFDEKVERLRAAGVALAVVPMAREVSPAADLRALWRLSRHLRCSRPDVVHTHSSKAGILGRLAAGLAGVPAVVHSPHAFAFQMPSGSLRRRFYLACERLAARRTHRLVAVSRAEAELALAAKLLPAKRVVVIENGVDPAGVAPREAGAAVRRELSIAPDLPVILFSGRLVPQKAPELFIRAAFAVLETHPDAVFLLAGEGPLRQELQRSVAAAGRERAIRFLGYRPDIARLYAAAQLLALPSRWEGLPYALLEAMAASLPVVGPEIPPLREVLGSAGAGLLVPPDDAGALAEALAGLLAHPERRRQIGESARARVLARYTLQRQVNELARLYTFLARGPGGRNETGPPEV